MIQKPDYDKILYFISQIQTEQDNYRETVLNLLHDLFGYNHLTFFLADSNNDFSNPVVINMSNELMGKYMMHYCKMDIFHPVNLLPKLLEKNVLTIEDVMPRREFEKTEYYNDLFRIDRLYYELAVPLKTGNTLLGGIGILNPKECGDFKKRDCQIIDCLSRHISINLANHLRLSKLEHENQIFRDSINNIPVGVIMLDGRFHIVNYNETAAEYCRNITDIEHNKVSINNIVEAILSKTGMQQQASSYCIEISLNAYSVKIAPFVVPNIWNSIDTYYVVYIIKKSRKDTPPLREIAAHYGWTAREREIVELIMNGSDNSEIGQKLFISTHTVKTHILNIFRKTNVSRRTALLSVISNFQYDHHVS